MNLTIKYMLSPKFTTDLQYKDITDYYSPISYDSIIAYIEWEVEIEFRDFGIKDITKIINMIILEREWRAEEDEMKNDKIVLDISEWTIDTDFTNYISSMEIDFRDKKITLL